MFSKPTTFVKCLLVVCIRGETKQRGPVQIATWVFVQYDEINLYVMSICRFFYCVFFFVSVVWFSYFESIFLTCLVLTFSWGAETISNQGTYQMHNICFCILIFYFILFFKFSYRFEFWLPCSHRPCVSHHMSQAVCLFCWFYPCLTFAPPRKIPLQSPNTAYLCWHWHPDIVLSSSSICCGCDGEVLSEFWKTECLTTKEHPSQTCNPLTVFFPEDSNLKWKCSRIVRTFSNYVLKMAAILDRFPVFF